MGIILEVYAEDTANFFHEGCGAGLLVIAIHVVAPVDFVNFGGGSASGRNFKIAREGEHGDVAGFLIETDDHDRIGKLGAVVSAVALGAFHVVTAGAKGKDVSATVFVSF